MTKAEFNGCISELKANTSRGDLSEDDLKLRIETFWKDFKLEPLEKLSRAVDWLIRAGVRFFPALSDVWDAVHRTATIKGHPDNCANCEGTGWVQVFRIDRWGQTVSAVKRCKLKE